MVRIHDRAATTLNLKAVLWVHMCISHDLTTLTCTEALMLKKYLSIRIFSKKKNFYWHSTFNSGYGSNVCHSNNNFRRTHQLEQSQSYGISIRLQAHGHKTCSEGTLTPVVVWEKFTNSYSGTWSGSINLLWGPIPCPTEASHSSDL